MRTINAIKRELKLKDTEILSSINFLEQNQIMLFSDYQGDKEDFEYFALCLEIFKRTGINYFEDYESLYYRAEKISRILNGDTSIFEYMFEYTVANLEADLELLILKSNFFEIKKIIGYDVLKLTQNKKQLIALFEDKYKKFELEKIKSKEIKSCEYNQKYFKFMDFTNLNEKFELVFKKLYNELPKLKKMINSEDMVLKFSQGLALNKNKKYLVFIYKNKKIIEIFKTSNSLNFKRFDDYNYDYASFLEVEEIYQDDLNVRFKLYFDLFLNQNDVTVNNLIFTRINAAKEVYKFEYGLTLPKIKKIIHENNLELNAKGFDYILNKVELDNAIKKYIKRN
ncbi:MAG: hypothetical protein ACRC41_14985 [Sarcina sp.]